MNKNRLIIGATGAPNRMARLPTKNRADIDVCPPQSDQGRRQTEKSNRDAYRERSNDSEHAVGLLRRVEHRAQPGSGARGLQRVRLITCRIALYAGYFVVLLLLATYLTGVMQEGILPRVRHYVTAPQHGELGRGSSTGPEESDEALAPAGGQFPSRPLEETSSKLHAPHLEPGAWNLDGGSEQSTAADRRETQLAERRAELLRLEEQIRQRKAESAIEEKWLATLRASGAQLTKERDVQRAAGIKKLAKLYEGMEPEAAAAILVTLEPHMAAGVLASMRDRQAAKALAAMNGQMARELSERLQEVRVDQTPGQEKTLRLGLGQAAEEVP